jgi:hypothetical protein
LGCKRTVIPCSHRNLHRWTLGSKPACLTNDIEKKAGGNKAQARREPKAFFKERGGYSRSSTWLFTTIHKLWEARDSRRS